MIGQDVAAIGLHAGCGQVEPSQITQPAGGEHHGLRDHRPRAAAQLVDQRQLLVRPLDALHPVDAGDHIDAAPLESVGHRLRHQAILGGQDVRGDVEHGHPAAESVEDSGKLAAGGRAAHHRHRPRQPLQAPDVTVDQGQLLAGKIQPPGAAAHGQDELAGPHLPAIGQGHGLRIHEARLAHVRVDLRARRLQMGAELLLLVDLVDDGLGAGQQLPEVQLGPGTVMP